MKTQKLTFALIALVISLTQVLLSSCSSTDNAVSSLIQNVTENKNGADNFSQPVFIADNAMNHVQICKLIPRYIIANDLQIENSVGEVSVTKYEKHHFVNVIKRIK